MSLAALAALAGGACGGAMVTRLCMLTATRAARRSKRAGGGKIVGSIREGLRLLGPPLTRVGVVARLAPARDLQARLLAAGEPAGLGVREWVSIKVGCAAIGEAVGLAVAPSLPGRLWIAALFGGPLAGFALPDFWLGRVAAARTRAAVRQLPDMLDLLRVALVAGMPPQRAMATVAARFDGPLADEWQRVAAASALGSPVDHSLSELGRRLPDPAVRSFAETMRSARRHGLTLSDALLTLAAGARHARQQRMREQAARAAPKIQLVVALVLVPAVMLVIAAGMVSQLSGSGLTGG